MFIMGIDFASCSKVFRLDFCPVLTTWYFVLSILFP